MKTISNYISRISALSVTEICALSCFVLIIFYSAACSKHSQTAAEKNTATLIGSGGAWNLSSVMVGGVDQTSMYSGMTLNFTATAYATTGGKLVWPASGTWSFASSDGRVIKRSDGIDISVTNINSNTLVLELDWASSTFSGRVSSTAGHHVFTFTR
jgi:hypothetical protein